MERGAISPFRILFISSFIRAYSIGKRRCLYEAMVGDWSYICVFAWNRHLWCQSFGKEVFYRLLKNESISYYKRMSKRGGIILSKWTAYQLLVVAGFVVLIILNNVFMTDIAKFFTFTKDYIETGLLITFFVVILVVWGFATILLLQEKKRERLFVHKIWRIMPVITGVLFALSGIGFIFLFITIDLTIFMEMRWLLDVSLIYILVLLYLLMLSLVKRYGKADTDKGTVIASANYTVLALFAVLFLMPLAV